MSQYDISGYIACPQVQENLNEQFQHNPTTVVGPIGGIQLVNSPANTAGSIQTLLNPGGGKIKQVELVYQPRFTDDSSTSAVINCDGGNEYGETSKTYEIDPAVGASRSWTITPSEIAARCEADPAWVAKQVQAHMNALARFQNKQLADWLALNAGTFKDGSASKNTRTKLSTGEYVEDLTADVIFEMQQLEWSSSPIVLGDGLVNKYMRAMQAGCCELGVDLGTYMAQNPLTFMRDGNIGTALGDADSFIALGLGSVQQLKYNAFGSEIMQMNSPQLIQGLVTDPLTGITYDYLAKYDCGTWNFQLKVAFIFAGLPDDVYRGNDPLFGTNGILKFGIDNS